jgi:hypothetical protein
MPGEQPVIAPTPTTETTENRPDGLRRLMILIGETDLATLRASDGGPTTITAYRIGGGTQSDKAKAYRAEYRKRPDVIAKQRAYRAARAKRLRAEKEADAAATEPVVPIEPRRGRSKKDITRTAEPQA